MKNTLLLSLTFATLLMMSGCGAISPTADVMNNAGTEENNGGEEAAQRPVGWSEATHSTNAAPDYETVFPQDAVNRIDLVISEDNWGSMLADMTELMGEFGEGGAFGLRPGPEVMNNLPEDRPEAGDRQDKAPLNGLPGGNGFQGADGVNINLTDTNPVWVTATIEFEGNEWDYVGVRFKGNSSLRSAWSSGNLKLPFKLDFDQFEDEYPQIEDQRFYGFKQLSLASNFNDDSYLREKVTADIFRAFGVPSAQTAFYEVYVNYGEGPVYFGLYTMVEMVEDTVITEQFASNDGNLYKPEGPGATFAAGSFTEISFDKETNQDEADYSDIQALFAALHADTRLTDAMAWRIDMEKVFDVDNFLRWLAVNTVIQNWDTYGIMSHNYFLYTDPDSGWVTWIPWDNNHALSGMGVKSALSLSLDEVTDDWPLIRFLMDDPVYQAQYETYLSAVVEAVFVPEDMAETYHFYHDLIAPYALAETPAATMLRSKQAFQNSVQILNEHVNTRYQDVHTYLGF